MDHVAMRQKGWTLFEMVLTLALSGVIFALLALSLFQPIQNFFWLQHRQERIKPLLMATESFGQMIGNHAKNLQASPQKLQMNDRVFECADSSFKLKGKEEGVLAQNVLCSFELHAMATGWALHFHINNIDDNLTRLDRVYFIKGAMDGQ